jgi:hypothetical protein
MGYRSKMIFGVKSDKYKNELLEVLKRHDIYDSFEVIEAMNEFTIYIGDWLKWYSLFDDVKEVNELIHIASEDGDNGFMVGCGEDGRLHDEIGCWWDFVSHHSDIDIH